MTYPSPFIKLHPLFVNKKNMAERQQEQARQRQEQPNSTPPQETTQRIAVSFGQRLKAVWETLTNPERTSEASPGQEALKNMRTGAPTVIEDMKGGKVAPEAVLAVLTPVVNEANRLLAEKREQEQRARTDARRAEQVREEQALYDKFDFPTPSTKDEFEPLQSYINTFAKDNGLTRTPRPGDGQRFREHVSTPYQRIKIGGKPFAIKIVDKAITLYIKLPETRFGPDVEHLEFPDQWHAVNEQQSFESLCDLFPSKTDSQE